MVYNMHLDITILTSEPANVSSNTRTKSAAASASLSRTAGRRVLQNIPNILLLSFRNHDFGAATRTIARSYISMASSRKSMPSRLPTGRAFKSLPLALPEPWAPASFDDAAEDFICEDALIGGPCQYLRNIPETPPGWNAAWDSSRDAFLHCEDHVGMGYYYLDIRF